jgi:hypothetical protein
MKLKILQATALLTMTASVIVAAVNHTGRVHEKCNREWERMSMPSAKEYPAESDTDKKPAALTDTFFIRL